MIKRLKIFETILVLFLLTMIKPYSILAKLIQTSHNLRLRAGFGLDSLITCDTLWKNMTRYTSMKNPNIHATTFLIAPVYSALMSFDK